jgi:hypothetical protein
MTIDQRQCILKFFGCYDGIVDGDWGALSAQGTRKLQQKLGVPDDGIWGPQTEEAARKAIGEGNDLEKDQGEVISKTERPTGDYWDHIKYWTREEFRCRCREYYALPFCGGFPVEPDQTLVELVDDLREKAGRPGHRSSGIRCQIHNSRQPGAAANSKHLQGKALDFYIEGLSGAQLLQMAQADPRTSYAYIIKQGEPYVHVDVK